MLTSFPQLNAHFYTNIHVYTHVKPLIEDTQRPLIVPSLFLFFKLIFLGVELIYNVVLVSAVQQSKSVIHIHTFTLF